jgi:hypothetical protein
MANDKQEISTETLTMDDVAYLRSLGDRAKGATTTSVSRQWFYDFAERLESTLKAEKARGEKEPKEAV